jgi:hypothetical protein
MPEKETRLVDHIWRIHALFYLVSGVWPILHMRSFEAVSGRKTDRWLVKTVSSLIVVTGGVIGSAGTKNRITPEVVGLAIGSSASLATIDVVYVFRGRISKVYLLDALAQALLIVGWVVKSMSVPVNQR